MPKLETCDLSLNSKGFFTFPNTLYHAILQGMNNKGKVCILGGSGFVGSELCARLAALGYSVKLLTRHENKCRHLKVLPALSVVQIANYTSEAIAANSKDCDVLINLIGILNEKGNSGKEFHHVHVGITRAALHACEVSGIQRLLQMSALNADPNGPSHYLRSKGKAENYLKTFCDKEIKVTIFKPSVIFGEGDSFLNRFAQLLKLTPGIFPLACANARFAPVYVGDVVKKFAASINDEGSFGASYNLCGPNEYSLKELVQYTANICGSHCKVIGLPKSLSRIQAKLLEHFPGKPFSIDNFNSLSIDSTCHQATPCTTSLQAIAPTYLGKNDFSLHLCSQRTLTTLCFIKKFYSIYI